MFAFRFLGSVAGASIMVHVICGTPLLYKKKKKTSIFPADDSIQRYNNSTGNVDLANNLITGFIIAAFLLLLITVLIDWKNQVVIPTILGYTIFLFVGGVILPLKIIIVKPEIIEHCFA